MRILALETSCDDESRTLSAQNAIARSGNIIIDKPKCGTNGSFRFYDNYSRKSKEASGNLETEVS